MYPLANGFDPTEATARIRAFIEKKLTRDGHLAPIGFVMRRDGADGMTRVEQASDLGQIATLEDQREALRLLATRVEGAFAVFHAAEFWMPEAPRDPVEKQVLAAICRGGQAPRAADRQDGILFLAEVAGEGLQVWSGLIERGPGGRRRIASWDPAESARLLPYLPAPVPVVLN